MTKHKKPTKEQFELAVKIASYGVPTVYIAKLLGTGRWYFDRYTDCKSKREETKELRYAAAQDLEDLGYTRGDACMILGVNAKQIIKENGFYRDNHFNRYVLIDPEGVKHRVSCRSEMISFCVEHFLNFRVMEKVCNGSKKSYLGWTGYKERA
jgi:hypothetical protein